jgi:hypothetical protein
MEGIVHFCVEEAMMVFSMLSAGSLGVKIVAGKVAKKLAPLARRASGGAKTTDGALSECKCPDKTP